MFDWLGQVGDQHVFSTVQPAEEPWLVMSDTSRWHKGIPELSPEDMADAFGWNGTHALMRRRLLQSTCNFRIWGDANCDGTFNAADTLHAKNYALGNLNINTVSSFRQTDSVFGPTQVF